MLRSCAGVTLALLLLTLPVLGQGKREYLITLDDESVKFSASSYRVCPLVAAAARSREEAANRKVSPIVMNDRNLERTARAPAWSETSSGDPSGTFEAVRSGDGPTTTEHPDVARARQEKIAAKARRTQINQQIQQLRNEKILLAGQFDDPYPDDATGGGEGDLIRQINAIDKQIADLQEELQALP